MTGSLRTWEPKALVRRWLSDHPRGPEREDFLTWFADTLEDPASHRFHEVPHETQDVRLTIRDTRVKVAWIVWTSGSITLLSLECPCHGLMTTD